MLYDTFYVWPNSLYLQHEQGSIPVPDNKTPMKLIADSGSTKTAWRLIEPSGNIKEARTTGMNPFFRTEDDIFEELYDKLLPVTGAEIRQVFFYGAGVTSSGKSEIIQNAVKRIYPQSSVTAQSDVLGAARALFADRPGITCIIGTGSNACLYDGKEIKVGISPLGFILGDEGSGAVMGRKLLGDYFKQVMPAELRTEFSDEYQPNREETLNRVYRAEKPNQYLAGFVPFLAKHLGHSYCRDFVNRNFGEFFERNVTKLPDFRNYPIGFVGSVAFYFSAVLNDVAAKYGFDNLTIIKNPIDGLVRYYQKIE